MCISMTTVKFGVCPPSDSRPASGLGSQTPLDDRRWGTEMGFGGSRFARLVALLLGLAALLCMIGADGAATARGAPGLAQVLTARGCAGPPAPRFRPTMCGTRRSEDCRWTGDRPRGWRTWPPGRRSCIPTTVRRRRLAPVRDSVADHLAAPEARADPFPVRERERPRPLPVLGAYADRGRPTRPVTGTR